MNKKSFNFLKIVNPFNPSTRLVTVVFGRSASPWILQSNYETKFEDTIAFTKDGNELQCMCILKSVIPINEYPTHIPISRRSNILQCILTDEHKGL